jgi:hypothetical protein
MSEAERIELQILRAEVARLKALFRSMFGMGPDDGPMRVSTSQGSAPCPSS